MNNQIQFGDLNTLEVRKVDLLDILKKNREKHNFLYDASVSGYRETVAEKLEEVYGHAAESAEKWKEFSAETHNRHETWDGKGSFALPNIKLNPIPSIPAAPISYEKYYNEAIQKLELSIHEVFRLNESEYQQYVQNNWQWKNQFVGYTNSVLLNKQAYTGLCYGAGDAILTCSGMLDRF